MPLQFKGTPAEILKAYGTTPERFPAGPVLLRLLEDKGYGVNTVLGLGRSNSFGGLFTSLVLRSTLTGLDTIYDFLARALPQTEPDDTIDTYTASSSQNAAIDLALSTSNAGRGIGVFFGQGLATHFAPAVRIPTDIRNVPVAVIGYGAAGILATYALMKLGFASVFVFERAKPLGIWEYENVYSRARNNPRALSVFDRSLKAAPGSGDEVRRFLENLVYENNRNVRFSAVTAVRPRDLDNSLVFADGSTERFPIVINTIGQGKPAPLSDPDRMTTTTAATLAGPRWQQTLTRADVHRKYLVFVGLGNSTAEMLRQIHELQDAGADTDYRILTHYPADAVHNPEATVMNTDGKSYRMFRNPAVNLVSYQGDLSESRYDYFRALRSGKITSDVRTWEVKKSSILVNGKRGLSRHDGIYTLTGYRHDKATLTSMGCGTEDGCVRYDWDGEMRGPYDDVLKGYFGFGAVLRSPTNPNAVVIPGMLHRLGDLAFGVAMRAAEHLEKEKR